MKEKIIKMVQDLNDENYIEYLYTLLKTFSEEDRA